MLLPSTLPLLLLSLFLLPPQEHKLYRGRVARQDVPPHIFFLANTAYEDMLLKKRDQCFVIRWEPMRKGTARLGKGPGSGRVRSL